MTDGWTGNYGIVNGKALRTRRLNAHSWEAFVDDESVGNHPTRRQARAFAEQVATGNWQDPDDDGGWDHRYEGVHTNRKPRVTIPENCEAPNGAGHTTADCPGTECRRTGQCQVA